MNESASPHPEAQTMAAFIEGRLEPGELKSVSEHLRGCRDCRTVVSETARFEQEERATSATRPRARTWWLAVAAAVVAVVIAVPFIRRQASPIAQLIAAAPREHRLVEARLSGFPWARLQAPSRGEATPDPADLRLTGAAGEVLQKTVGRQDPVARHSAGVAYLLIGRSQESITALELAANYSNDAKSWNDLAAARYAIATRDERPSQLAEALADADHALRIDPQFAEARFNRALILERMGVREKARSAWQEFLELEPGSAWSVEARAHLQALSDRSGTFDPAMLAHPDAALVRAFPQEARKAGEGPLLCDWAAADNLSRARLLADALVAFNGEHLLDDAVAAIELGDEKARATLAEAHRIYCAARKSYDKRTAGDAEQQLRQAALLFERGRSPMALVAAYYAANAVFDQNRGPEAREQLLRLRDRIDATRYRALSAQISWSLAVAANSSGDVDTGAREALAAATIFRDLGERVNEAFVDAVAAYALQLKGESDAAWSRRIRALGVYCRGTDRQRCDTILADTATQLASLDQPEAALALTGATMRASGGEPFVDAIQSVKAARVAMRAGQVSIARRALLDAHDAGARIEDAALRARAETQIDIEDAALLRATEARRSIDTLTRSIDFLAAHDIGALLPYGYLQRARSYRKAGDETSALADYRTALREVEKQKGGIREADVRLSFLDTARQIIDELIELELSRGAVEAAFRVSEARHQLQSGAMDELPRLPAGTAAIEYVVLPHATVIFCLDRSGITARRVDVDRRDLDARIDALVSSIKRRAPIGDVQAASSAVHALLVDPVRARLAGIHQLVIVPDRRLFAVPFAALYDARSRRYLVEDFEIRFGPAVAGLSGEAPGALEPALVVADPPASRPRLSRGREEAEQVASAHHGTLLWGNAATRASFVDAAQRSALIYFAGHARSDSAESNAALLLADGAVLSESDIVQLRLALRPLVVLAACGTFRGDPIHVAGMSSLSRAFLVAGARAVVGTLWEIDDDDGAAMFLRFHENLRADASPARALRDAQLAMLQSSDLRLMHPATWAPVELLTKGG